MDKQKAGHGAGGAEKGQDLEFVQRCWELGVLHLQTRTREKERFPH